MCAQVHRTATFSQCPSPLATIRWLGYRFEPRLTVGDEEIGPRIERPRIDRPRIRSGRSSGTWLASLFPSLDGLDALERARILSAADRAATDPYPAPPPPPSLAPYRPASVRCLLLQCSIVPQRFSYGCVDPASLPSGYHGSLADHAATDPIPSPHPTITDFIGSALIRLLPRQSVALTGSTAVVVDSATIEL